MKRFNPTTHSHRLAAVAALALFSQPLLAELGCPTGLVPDGNEKVTDGSFVQGYASFTTAIPFKFPRGQYPTDGNPPNSSPYPTTAISIIDGNVDLGGIVQQAPFPGDPNPGAGLPPVPAIDSWFAYNGVDAGAPSKLWEQEIGGLEPNTDYAFSAYVSNALAPGQQAVGAAAPQLALHIDGVQTGNLFPVCDAGGPLDPVQNDCANEATQDRWQRIAVTANPGGKDTIKIAIHDAQPLKTSYGNDLAMTRVSLQKCVPIGTPDIDIRVDGNPADTVSFSPFTPGGAAVERTITVTNNGTGTLVIGNIANPANPDFTIVTDNCSTQSLGAGESCTIVMHFTPGDEASTVLSIPSNDPDEDPAEVTLKSERQQGQSGVLGDSGANRGEILTRLDGGVGGFGLPFALALLPLALRRRRLIAAATLLGLGATTVQAEQGQFYLGGGFGMSDLEPKIVNLPLRVDENNDKVFKFVLGYDLLDWLSVEGFGARMGSASISNGADIDYNSYGVGVVANLPNNVSGFSLLGRLGYGQIDNSGNIAYREVEDYEIYAGIGLEYQFDNDFSLRGEYDYIDKDATMITMSLVKRFGGKEEPQAPPPITAAPAPKVAEVQQPVPTPALPKPQPPEVITLVLEPIHFATDSAALTPDARSRLNRIVDVMRTYPQVKLLIVGHTDNRASDQYNLILSLKRAKAAMDYLMIKGIDRQRLAYEGRGEREPIADNRTKEGRAKNRRAEFHPTPQKVEKKR